MSKINRIDVVEAILGDRVVRPSGVVKRPYLLMAALGWVPDLPNTVIPMITRGDERGSREFAPFHLTGSREEIKEALCQRLDEILDALDSVVGNGDYTNLDVGMTRDVS